MKCPKCQVELICGCPTCIERNKKRISDTVKFIEWVENDNEQCSNCGHTAHCDWWMEQEAIEHEQRERVCEKE